MKQIWIILLTLGMFVTLAAAQAVAAGNYETAYSGDILNGSMKSVDGCYMTFTVYNVSVQVVYNGPGYTYREVNIPVGQTDYYYDKFRVYIARIDINNSTATVDIARFVSSGDGTPTSGTKVTCDTPGQTALGGDVVTFLITIQNNDQSDHTYDLSANSDVNWDVWFEYGDKGIYKIYVPAKQSKTVDLNVQTLGSTAVGEKKVWGYVDNTRFDVSIDITSANQSADVSYKVSSKIAYIGDKVTYDLHIKNVQAKENLYHLAVTGLPDSWYYRFKESAASTEELAEVILPASSDKDLALEIVPPYSVGTGDYNFTAVVTTPDGVAIKKDLTLTLKSGIGMSMDSVKLAYDAKPGESFNVAVYVRNTGQGSALTNVYLDVSAPEGWLIQTTPNQTNSIRAGEYQAFTVSVTPPGNIVPSDYIVNIKAKSDQMEKENDYRITIKTDSIVPYLGGGIIVLVVAGLFLVYRKYGRR